MCQTYDIERVTPPAYEPVSLALAKRHCNVVADDDDALIRDILIPTARELVENNCSRSLVTQTLRLTADGFPTWKLALPRPPVQSVSSVKYYDANGVQQTLDASYYEVYPSQREASLWLAQYEAWPITQVRPDAVQVEYVAGYAEGSTSVGSGSDDLDELAPAVPHAAKLAILLLVAHWYRCREPSIIGMITSEVAFSFEALIKSLRVGVYP